MFCSFCGKEINDQAVVCPHCGAQTGNAQQIPQQPNYNVQQNYGAPQQNPNMNQYPQQNQPDETNVGLVVLSVLVPIVGIILGAIYLSNGNKNSGKAYLIAGVIAIVVEMIIGIILGIVIVTNTGFRIALHLD